MPAELRSVADAAFTAALRVAALAMALIGCGHPECPLEDVLDPIVQDRVFEDCGYVYAPSSDGAEYQAARGCVVDALTARAPFQVSWSDGAIEGGHTRFLLGLNDDGWQTYLVDRYQTAQEEEPPYPYFRSWACADLEDRGACFDTRDTFCFLCAAPQLLDTCGDPPAGDPP